MNPLCWLRKKPILQGNYEPSDVIRNCLGFYWLIFLCPYIFAWASTVGHCWRQDTGLIQGVHSWVICMFYTCFIILNILKALRLKCSGCRKHSEPNLEGALGTKMFNQINPSSFITESGTAAMKFFNFPVCFQPFIHAPTIFRSPFRVVIDRKVNTLKQRMNWTEASLILD